VNKSITKSLRSAAASVLGALALLTVSGTGQATQFTTFQEYSNPLSPFVGSDGAYPGRIYITNNRNESVCVAYKFHNDSGNVIMQVVRPLEVGAKQVRASLVGPGQATTTMHFWVFAAHEGHCRWNFDSEQIHVGRGSTAQGNVAGVNSLPRIRGSYTFDGSRWSGKQGDEINVIVN
jgi:hypothetical protein